MVEVALIGPIFLVLLFGVLEFGTLFRDVLSVKDAVGDAARYGSILGPETASDAYVTDANADYWIVRRVREGTAALPVANINRIVVYKAGPSTLGNPVDQVTSTCRNGSGDGVDNVCNVYLTYPAFQAVDANDKTYFDDSSGTSPARHWRPTARNNGADCRCSSQIEYIGVYVRLQRAGLTGLFGSSFKVEEAQILRLEPSLAVLA